MIRNYFPTFLPLFVVAIIVISRRPANALRRRGAVSPETALSLEDMSANDRRRFERLIAQGVIKESASGRYYYDQAGERAKVRQRMPLLIGLIVVLLAIAVALAWWSSTHAPRRTPAPAPASSGAAS